MAAGCGGVFGGVANNNGAWPPQRLVAPLVQGMTAVEIGPAMPHPRGDRPEEVSGAKDGAAAAHVVAVVGHEQAPIGREGEAKGVAKAPRHQLRGSAVQRDPQHGPATRHLAADHPTGDRFRTERRKGTRLGTVVGLRGKRVVGREMLAGQGDVPAREVVEAGVAPEPAEVGVVLTDDAGVRVGAHADIESPVRPEGWPVGVVVAPAGQVCEQRRDVSVRCDPENAPAVKLPALGDIDAAGVIKGHTGRESQAAHHGLDAIPGRQCHVGGADDAGRGKGGLTATCRGPQPETAGESHQGHTDHEKEDAYEQQTSPPARPMSLRPRGRSVRLVVRGSALTHTHVSPLLLIWLLNYWYPGELDHQCSSRLRRNLVRYPYTDHEGEVVDLTTLLTREIRGVAEKARPGDADIRGELTSDFVPQTQA